MRLDQAQLEALRAVIDAGTFEGAARLLHVTPSAVSQRIRALEESVGRVLLRRSRPIVATESGVSLLRLGSADRPAQRRRGARARRGPVRPVGRSGCSRRWP